jgi:hypothetical protein
MKLLKMLKELNCNLTNLFNCDQVKQSIRFILNGCENSLKKIFASKLFDSCCFDRINKFHPKKTDLEMGMIENQQVIEIVEEEDDQIKIIDNFLK